MSSNKAPKTKWHRCVMSCGTIRHRLYVNGQETPYFVDDAKAAGIGHRTMGKPVGLFGSGLGKEVYCRDGGSYRVAETLGAFENVTLAKMAAERFALT